MVQCCWRSSLTSFWTHHISRTPGLSPWFVLSPKCSQSWGLTINPTNSRLETDSDLPWPWSGVWAWAPNIPFEMNLNENECHRMSSWFEMFQNELCLNYFELMSFKEFEDFWLLQLQFLNLFRVAQNSESTFEFLQQLWFLSECFAPVCWLVAKPEEDLVPFVGSSASTLQSNESNESKSYLDDPGNFGRRKIARPCQTSRQVAYWHLEIYLSNVWS